MLAARYAAARLLDGDSLPPLRLEMCVFAPAYQTLIEIVHHHNPYSALLAAVLLLPQVNYQLTDYLLFLFSASALSGFSGVEVLTFNMRNLQ